MTGADGNRETAIQITTIDGGITAAADFRSGAVHCGLKRDKLDLALIVSDTPASAAGVFTTNRAVAAPVIVCREHLDRSGGVARAIAVNSGCANACTGTAGMKAARDMADAVSVSLACPLEQTLIASTGVIGLPLATSKVEQGITSAFAALQRGAGRAAAEAIMTTDLWPKEASVRVTTATGSFVVGGMAKGAGMIEPMMATMLAFVTTDARIEPVRLRRALREVTDDTFNAITVDGECSTNDSVFLLANGASDVTIDDESYQAFVAGLREVCATRGGEGATKLIAVRVTGRPRHRSWWRGRHQADRRPGHRCQHS